MNRRNVIYFCALGLCLLLQAAAVAGPSARALVKEGLRDFEAERHEAALQKFQQAKEADPEFEGLDLNIGHALMKLGKYDEAEKHYDEILNSQKGAAFKGDIDYNRGVSHFKRGAELVPEPSVEGLLKQGYLEQKSSADGQPSLELKPEGQEALQKALEEYGKSLELTKSAVPQISDSKTARTNYELTRRQFDKTQKLLEIFQPPQQQQQQGDQQDKQNKDQKDQQQQQNQEQQNEQEQQQKQQQNEDQQQQQSQEQQPEQQESQEQKQEQQQPKEQEEQQDQQQQRPSQGEQDQQKQDQQSPSGQPQEVTEEEGMRPEDAMALLNTLNDMPQEEQLKEMLRYQMRGMRPLNPDW